MLPLTFAPVVHATLTYTITTTDGSGCTALGGSWSSPTCTVVALISALTIHSENTLDVGAGVTVNVIGTGGDGIYNDGTIND